MTDQELRDLIAELSRSTTRLEKSQEETDRQIKQVNKQLGEMGNKFGSFTEGLALPSMEKVFYGDFGLDVVQPRARRRKNGRTLEIDVLAYDYAGDRKEAYIVEVKSHLTEEGIEQILKTIEDFPKFFSHLSDRKIYGVIAALDIPENLRKKVLRKGLYLARISDDTFRLQVSPDFKPKAFGRDGRGESNGRKKNGEAPAKKRAKRAKKESR